MAHLVNAGARLDRLPISSFHYRIFGLVGAGMFFDGYDLYVAGGVLASITPPSNVDVDVIWPLAPAYSVTVPAYALPLQPWRNAVRPAILSPANVALFQLGPQ